MLFLINKKKIGSKKKKKKILEIMLSLSPATLFSDVSLPNHTKMFELGHMVTSMEDFG
jgi:hypothetical protein